jgi:beta-lactamase regulating signal transducer with metallopeptidase domain
MAERFRVRRRLRIDSLEGWRRNSEQDSRQSQDQFDKALMALSASGIGVTIAFLDKIVPFHDASLKWLLFLIWLTWGLCLLATMFSFYASVRALARSERQIAKEIDAVRIAPNPDDVPAPKNDGGKWNTATKALNEVAAVLFILGLIAMLVFIWYNLLMASKSTNQQANESNSALGRPTQAAPITKGLTSTQRPTGSGPSTANGGNASGSATPSGQTKK